MLLPHDEIQLSGFEPGSEMRLGFARPEMREHRGNVASRLSGTGRRDRHLSGTGQVAHDAEVDL